jgi:uncharacterized protein (DUF4415 family)
VRKNERTERFTQQDLNSMRDRGDDRTDWTRLDTLTDEEVAASIDREEEGEIDWSTVQIGLPSPKQQLTVRFDQDVIEWFKAQGAGYQTRMNAVLRSFVDAQKGKTSQQLPRRK